MGIRIRSCTGQQETKDNENSRKVPYLDRIACRNRQHLQSQKVRRQIQYRKVPKNAKTRQEMVSCRHKPVVRALSMPFRRAEKSLNTSSTVLGLTVMVAAAAAASIHWCDRDERLEQPNRSQSQAKTEIGPTTNSQIQRCSELCSEWPEDDLGRRN